MKSKTLEKTLECVVCGNRFTIRRKSSKDRPAGHIKHLWCSQCETKSPHQELDEFEDSFEKNMKALSGGGSHG